MLPEIKRDSYDKNFNLAEYITIISVYVPNNRVPKYIRQKLTKMKEKTDNSIIIVENLISCF